MGRFEIFDRAGSKSVHGRPYPAVNMRRGSFVFNRLALDELGVDAGDALTIQFNRAEGLIAFERPRPDYAPSMSAKLARTPKSSDVTLQMGQFLRWAGIDIGKAKGIYRLGYDEKTQLHMFSLPAGSWEKPQTVLEAPPAVRGRLRRAAGLAAD